MPSPRRILIRGVNWLGDAVMTTPALLRLRALWPHAHITLLTADKLAGLWPGHPAVDAVLTFAPGESVWQLAGRLRAEQFDFALALPNSTRTALELWLARIPQRVGYANAGRNWLLTQAVPHRPGVVQMRKRTPGVIRQLVEQGRAPDPPIPSSAHHLHHYLHLVAALGASADPLPPRIEVSADELAAVRQKFGLHHSEDRPLLGLNAGAEYGPAKRWPKENFIAAARAVQRQMDCTWVVFGGRADMELAESITLEIGSPNVINLAGKTSLRELCAALQACRVVLTNDTGPMHLAAAVGSTVVVPFGSTSPEFTGPGLPGDPRHHFLKANVPCTPCFLRECPIDFRCMQSISVDSVVHAVMQATAQDLSR
jgi:heptosyltransferase-2